MKVHQNHSHTDTYSVYGLRHMLSVVHKLLMGVNRKLRGKQAFLMLMKISGPVCPFQTVLCYQAGQHNKRCCFVTHFPYESATEGESTKSNSNKKL